MKVVERRKCYKCNTDLLIVENEDGKRVPLVSRRTRAYLEHKGEYLPGPLIYISHFVDCPKREAFKR